MAKLLPITKEDKFYERTNKDIRTMMTYEGRIADIYWNNLKIIFNKLYPEFNFKSRNNTLNSHNRNASDEINALLNYGYSLLETEVRRDISTVGLDNAIPFLHELQDSRSSLVYDLQELFRWLIDLSVIQLLEEKKIKKSDFIVTESYCLRLRESGAKMLISKVKTNLNSTAEFKGKNYTYSSILYENVVRFAKGVLNDTPRISFDIPFIKLKRHDTDSMREKILDITPEERKKLGINKSTLWYQKKHIRENKKIKIYRKIRDKIS